MLPKMTIKIEHGKISEKHNAEWNDIFIPGCFIDKDIGMEYRVLETEWKETEDGKMIRYIKKAELISVSILDLSHT